MTVDSVRAAIAEHQHLAQVDPERWHSFLDDLCKDVLRAIHAGHDKPAHLAAAALDAYGIPAAWHACA